MSGELLVFAYGSLMARPGFPVASSRVAGVRGFVRRFWQGSTDHRGVPGAPGRVVTLVPKDDGVTWGLALGVAPADEARVLAQLDHREKGGYSRMLAPLLDHDGGELGIDALVYAALPGNPEWLGDAPLPVIAGQIRGARGPSGPNSDYLLDLARHLVAIGVDDQHVFDLADAVEPTWRTLCQKKRP